MTKSPYSSPEKNRKQLQDAEANKHLVGILGRHRSECDQMEQKMEAWLTNRKIEEWGKVMDEIVAAIEMTSKASVAQSVGITRQTLDRWIKRHDQREQNA